MDPEVRFLPSGRRVRVPAGTSLLEAALRAGLPVARACGADGLCARCGLDVVEGADSLGEPDASERDAMRRNRVDPRLRLACRVCVTADLVVTAAYW